MIGWRPNFLRRAWFFLRTGHRDPLSFIDSFAKKQPKDGEVLTEQHIREAMKKMPEDMRL